MQDCRDRAEISPDEVDAWVNNVIHLVLEGADASVVLDGLAVIPYHGTYAAALLEAFVHHKPMPHDIVSTEQYLLLNEVIGLWQTHSFAPDHTSSFPVPMDVIQVTLQGIRVPVVAQSPNVVPLNDKRVSHVTDMWTQDDVVHQLRQQLSKESQRHVQFPAYVPVPVSSKPVFLYLFSGRRREGDIQCHLEEFCSGWTIDCHILLVDLALSPEHDVTNPTLMHKFVNWLVSGKVAGLMLAPPCETWSEARFQQTLTPGDPRPVRSDTDRCASQD